MSENGTEAVGEDTLTFNLTLTAAPSAPRVPVKVSKTATAAQLRSQASAATKIPVSSIKLIFRGRLIGDDDTKKVVEEFKLEDGCVIHCMGKPEDTGTSAPTTSASLPMGAGSSVSVPPVAASVASSSTTTGDPLQAALGTLRTSNTSDVYLTAVQTLEKVLTNITSHPMEEKYRRVKKKNAAFQRRLGGLTGGDAAMRAVGFNIDTVEGDECYVLVASAEAWPKLVANKNAVSTAVSQAKRAAASGSAPPVPPSASLPGASATGFPGPGASTTGFPGMGSAGLGNVEGTVANMMSDPQALQSMLQNPMVRQMLERDPRFANNPMLRQNLDALASNPEQLNQISQLMRDPNTQRQMQAMMNSGQMPPGMGGMGGMGGFGGAAATGAGSSNVARAAGDTGGSATAPAGSGTTTQQTDSGRTDEEMTEEEMIAEAIARSMRET